jgi:hypothetical protein
VGQSARIVIDHGRFLILEGQGPVEGLTVYEFPSYNRARTELSKIAELTVLTREAKAFEVPAGHFFRVVCVEGPQVGRLSEGFSLRRLHACRIASKPVCTALRCSISRGVGPLKLASCARAQ